MESRQSPARRDEGFALVTALVAVMIFALIAYAILAADRGAIAQFDGQLTQARLEAAADAGLATAIQGLSTKGPARWPIDGRSRSLPFDGILLTVKVEDERGKIDLNGLTPDLARRLLSGAGVSGARLDQLTDSLLDWEDGQTRPNGAKPLDYAAQGLRPRAGPFRTLDELAQIKGMDPLVYARLVPVLTLFFGDDSGGFDHDTAPPLALHIMSAFGENTPDEIIRARELAGERPAIDQPVEGDLVGRPLTLRITAQDANGGAFQRDSVIELTGMPQHPFWIRAID